MSLNCKCVPKTTLARNLPFKICAHFKIVKSALNHLSNSLSPTPPFGQCPSNTSDTFYERASLTD